MNAHIEDLILSVDRMIWSMIRKQNFPTDIYSPEDLYQELMLHLSKVANGFIPDTGTAFSTWAYRVIMHKLINLSEKALRRASSKADTEGDVDFIAAKDYPERLDLEGMALSPNEDRLVRGVFEESRTQAELAKELGISSSAAGRIFQQALGKIRAGYERLGIRDGEARQELLEAGRDREARQHAPVREICCVW